MIIQPKPWSGKGSRVTYFDKYRHICHDKGVNSYIYLDIFIEEHFISETEETHGFTQTKKFRFKELHIRKDPPSDCGAHFISVMSQLIILCERQLGVR